MSTSHNDDEVNFAPQSQEDSPTDNDKGKRPLEEPPDPLALFQRLLGRRENTETIAVQASALLPMLTSLGMASEVTQDELCDMLKLSGYADAETGAVDFERFRVFAKDFMLLESLGACQSAWVKRQIDPGPVGDFFDTLESAKEFGFTTFDFIGAFARLDVELTENTADILVGYANLHTADKNTFEEYLEVLNVEHEIFLELTGRTTLPRRTYTLDKSSRGGRLLAFVSAYSRSHHASRGPATLPPEL